MIERMGLQNYIQLQSKPPRTDGPPVDASIARLETDVPTSDDVERSPDAISIPAFGGEAG